MDESVLAGWQDWLRFRDAFAEMLDPRFYTIEWLDGEIWSGRIRLLCNSDSAILVSFKAYPTGLTEIHGEAATGELQGIISDLIPSAIRLGKEMGCDVASIASKPAWSRLLRDEGWTVHQVEIRKNL